MEYKRELPLMLSFDKKFMDGIENGNVNIVREYLHRDDTSQNVINVGFRRAAEIGPIDIVHEFLISNKVDPSAYHGISLAVAVYAGQIEIVRVLLEDGRINPSVNNNRALEIAIERGHYDIVDMLMVDCRMIPIQVNNLLVEALHEQTNSDERNVRLLSLLRKARVILVNQKR